MTDLQSQELLMIREAVQECLELLREIRNDMKGEQRWRINLTEMQNSTMTPQQGRR